MRRDLPTGTVTFLFTDVEGSTKLLHSLGAEGYAEALAEHRRVIREACARHGAVEVDTQGDAFFFAFPTAPGALAAAGEMTEALASGPIQVRIGLHTGTPLLTEEGYVGDDVHFAARVAASSHGGQVVLSSATAEFSELDLLDLGEHRLKDIAYPVSIFQLGDGSFPPLKTISNTNLPRPASSFIGREEELSEVLSKIAAGARLLTLTGPGGTGKTRLALEAAATLVPEYRAGVFWVGLAALRDPTLVTDTIAQTLGAKDGLAADIRDRELLLLLDNLEQVIDAAPELSSLLSACPNLTLLVTSRELLRVQGEVEYPVPPLASPEAVSLFCARAQVEPSEEIAELCVRLDSLPLAVELAAARTKALSPAQILERLSSRLDLLKGGRDAGPRQQTLRATIEWSYDLLSDAEQQLFRRLSVFAGGCTLEAAEEVCDADLDALQSLVEKSLLRFSGGRYWILETIREYASERLEEAGGTAELDDRQACYYLAFAERLDIEERERRLTNAAVRKAGWPERANLLVALERFEHEHDHERELRLGAILGWATPLNPRQGADRFRGLIVDEDIPAAVRARALQTAVVIARWQGDYAWARELATTWLELSRVLGDERAIALALGDLALVATFEGDYDNAARLVSEAESIALDLDDATGWIEYLRAQVALYQRLLDEARIWFERRLESARKEDKPASVAGALGKLGGIALADGLHRAAAKMYCDSLEIRKGIALQHAERDFDGLAAVAVARGDARSGACLLGAADALFSASGYMREPFEGEVRTRTGARAKEALGDQTYEEALAEGRAMSLDEAVEYALASID